jgi:hypothetical protein
MAVTALNSWTGSPSTAFDSRTFGIYPLVAARDQAIVELRREKLQKETAEKPHKVARVRRW